MTQRCAQVIVSAGFVFTVLVATSAGRANQASQDPPVFRSSNDLVRVFATVTDSNDRLVTGLGQDSFEVRDKGSVRPVEVFDNTPTPIRLMIMLDVSGSMSGNMELLREAVVNLSAHLEPRDLARVGSFAGTEMKLGAEFTRDPSALLAGVPKPTRARSLEDTATPLWRALDVALQAFGARTEERRVLLVVSDGKNMPIGLGAGARTTSEEVADRARQNDVMIYAIGVRSRLSNRSAQPGSLTSSTLEDDLPSPILATLAADTGGGYVELRRSDDLKQEFARIADELHSQYLLGFTPSVRDGKVHEIKVDMKHRGMKARARRDYVAPAR